jgi:hypothetical protein
LEIVLLAEEFDLYFGGELLADGSKQVCGGLEEVLVFLGGVVAGGLAQLDFEALVVFEELGVRQVLSVLEFESQFLEGFRGGVCEVGEEDGSDSLLFLVAFDGLHAFVESMFVAVEGRPAV